MKLSVQLVTWNGERYLPDLFESLKNQTFKDFEILVWDNGSSDSTINIIENEKSFFKMEIFQQSKNFGFAPSHNALCAKSNSEYLLLINQDVIVDPACLQKMVAFMDKNERAASVAPRVMRIENGTKTNKVDSLGLKIWRSRRVVDIDAGKEWAQSPKEAEVFGVSAAIAMYRRSALKSNLFDDTYFSYQEDIDLAWKLRLHGFSSFVVFDAVAYHARSAKNDARDISSAVKNKRRQSMLVRYHSYKNHIATLCTNEQGRNFILDFPRIFWYEAGKFFYNLLFDFEVLKGLGDLWKNRKTLRQKRQEVQKGAKVTPVEIRKWFR